MDQANNESLIQWDQFEYLKNPGEYLDEYSNDIMDRIFEIILEWTILYNGISHNDLSTQVKLDRKTLRKYTKKLIEDNLIVREEGKRGKYLVKNKEITDNTNYRLISKILTDRFKNILFRDIAKKNYLVLHNKSQSMLFSNDNETSIDYDFAKNKQYYKTNFTEETLTEKNLFELSNLIGAFIIYLIMQSRNLDIINRSNKKSNLIGRNEIARNFIEKGMFVILNYIIRYIQFLNTKDDINRLFSAYSNLYPLLTYEFEQILPQKFRYEFHEILKGWTSKLETYKEYEQKFATTREKRKNCKHQYILYIQNKNGRLTETRTDSGTKDYYHSSDKKVKDKSDFYVKICSICNHRKRVGLKREAK